MTARSTIVLLIEPGPIELGVDLQKVLEHALLELERALQLRGAVAGRAREHARRAVDRDVAEC